MTKLPKHQRLLIIIQIEITLNDYCRAGCPPAFSYVISPSSSQCPINHKLRDIGRVLSPDKVVKPTAKRKYTIWTDEIDSELIALVKTGMRYQKIADHFNFSYTKVASRIKRLRNTGRVI